MCHLRGYQRSIAYFHVISSHITTLILNASAVVAAAPAPTPTTVAKLHDRATSCTFTDAAAASNSKTACSAIVLNNITVPSGTTLDMTKLNEGTTVIFEGTTSFGYKGWEGPLISFSGTKITVKGGDGHLIDGNGAMWWDGEGSNGGKTKPKFFYAHSLKQSTITGLSVKNTPVQGFSINSAIDLVLDPITIDNSEGYGDDGGHNTDTFDIGSSSGITISSANIKNRDDRLAINSGTNIHFLSGTCSGGHGLSIGSVSGRSDNDVDGVIENSTILVSQNGVRIKTVYDATGSVNNVTYRDITLSGITKYGILIEQDYENGSPTGEPTTGVPITAFTVDGVTGSVESSATPIYILCGEGSCSDWKWADANVTGGKTGTKCSGVPDGASC